VSIIFVLVENLIYLRWCLDCQKNKDRIIRTRTNNRIKFKQLDAYFTDVGSCTEGNSYLVLEAVSFTTGTNPNVDAR
jgi:hypothetical protein